MNLFYTVACIVILFTLASCAKNTSTNIASNTRPADSTDAQDRSNSVANADYEGDQIAAMTDADFVKAMAINGESQVELGKLASKKATDPQVKTFAEKMVSEYSKSNEELKALATKLRLTLPVGAPRRNPLMENLSRSADADFDRKYVQIMVDVHLATSADFEKKAKDAIDPELKAFAEKTLPGLKERLQSINGIHARMK